MKREHLVPILQRLRIEIDRETNAGWLIGHCPLAPYTPAHKGERDNSASFCIKINDEGKSGYNCFNGDVKFLTKLGVMRFADSVDTYQEVLAPNGEWVSALISSFGKQILWRLTLTRNKVKKVILTTANHRWFARTSNNRPLKELTTVQLRHNHQMISVLPSPVDDWAIDPNGVAHGIVFGDGTTRKDRPLNGVLCLFGIKRELAKFFYHLATTIRDVEENDKGYPAHTRITGPFSYMKEPPSVDMSRAYLLGFIAGYLATDGSVASTGVSISSARESPLRTVKAICNYVGVATFQIKEQERKGYRPQESTAFTLQFIRSTLNNALFVRPDQLARLTIPGYERLGWRVESVEETGLVETVYCATVPQHGAFVLDDYLLTGNCYTCKAKGTLVELITVLGHHRRAPSEYAAMALQANLKESFAGSSREFGAVKRKAEKPKPLNEKLFEGMYPPAWTDIVARTYLGRRGIGEHTCEALNILFDPDEKRIMFPIRDRLNRLYGFTGRTILPDAIWKKMHAYGKVKDYGFDESAKDGKKQWFLLGENLVDLSKPVIVVEGLFALAHFIEIGVEEFANVVATMGSSMSDQQARILEGWGKAVYMFYDLDQAGRQGLKGQLNAAGKFIPGAFHKLWQIVPTYSPLWPPNVRDPDKLTLEQVRRMVLRAQVVANPQILIAE